MKTIRAYIKRHPVLAYYALVFTISWGSILRGRGRTWPIPGHQGAGRETDAASCVLALFAGPSVAGIAMTGLVGEGWPSQPRAT